MRVKDIDWGQNQILVRGGKGDKDRYTMLPAPAREPLLRHLEAVERQHRADLAQGRGAVALPDALSRKYPGAARDWGWQWVFPASSHYADPLSGEKRRHHIHQSVLQRAFQEARRRAGIVKPASCHTLRHSFAYVVSSVMWWVGEVCGRCRSSLPLGLIEKDAVEGTEALSAAVVFSLP